MPRVLYDSCKSLVEIVVEGLNDIHELYKRLWNAPWVSDALYLLLVPVVVL